jgi:hypothetical protein
VPYPVLRWLDGLAAGRLPPGRVAQVHDDVGLFVYVVLMALVFAATARDGVLAGLNVFPIAGAIPRRPLVAGRVALVAPAIGVLGFAVIVGGAVRRHVRGRRGNHDRGVVGAAGAAFAAAAGADAGRRAGAVRPRRPESDAGGWSPTVRR